jgi:hypothetical protein
MQLAGCPRQAGEYLGTLQDRIVLDRLFLDDNLPVDDQLREAIGQQLKYLWGYYRNEPAAHASAQLVLSAEAPRIEIVKKSQGTYGRDLDIAWKGTGPHLKIDQPYQSKAVARGFTRAADPALIIDYRVRFKVAICGRPRADESTLPTLMPRDPWLMHWHVPQSAHRRLCYFNDCSVTSPCNDDDYADLPHPFYHWYDWYPDRHGPDADGRGFDCRRVLKPDVDYFAREVRLSRLAGNQATADFTRLRASLGPGEPLRATVLIGVLDHDWKDLAFPSVVKAFDGAASVPARAAELLSSSEARERGTAKFLRLLAMLPQIMRVARAALSVEGGYLKAEVQGTLARSGRAARVNVHVGLTDVFGPTPPGHWSILRRALAEDQVIVYGGHSGIGENFRLAQIEKNLGEPHDRFQADFARAPYQLIAFLSCYSYMYFGQDLVAAAGETAAGREFVYTGTEFTRGDEGALAILDFVDQVAAGAATPEFHYVDPEDFLMVKRVDGSGR